MLKILLWVVSKYTTYLEDALKILEQQHNGIELVDTVAGEEIAAVDAAEYDVLLVVGARQIGMSDITKVARQLNLPEEKLLGDWIVCIPGFTLDKYRRLQRSQLSIISMNCFGGLISYTFGLPFRTPIINMWLDASEYMRFLRAPRVYMEERLIFKKTAWEDNLKFDYPIFTLGNIDIHMNHYRDFDAAVAKWNERKARINWFNLFVTMHTEDEKLLQEFDTLPYGKKVCFVPFKSDLDSAWYINPKVANNDFFWRTVNHFAEGKPFYYDVFDMLLYGKKTPLIKM